MNVLITGGNGFLGSNIARKMLEGQHRVYLFSKNTNNIQDILPNILFDFSDNKQLVTYEDSIKAFAPDVVIHCAWNGGNKYTDTTSLDQFYENIDPSIRLLELLTRLEKKPKFVGFGSFAEYGNISTPVTETAQEAPTNMYGLSKYVFKKYSEMLCEQSSMEWVWIRPCYVYGPGDVDTRLLPRVVSKFINDEAIVLNECTSVVDYLYIEDFVNSLYSLLQSRHTGVYNICSGKQYRVKDVVEQIHRQVGSVSSMEFDSSLKRTSTYSYTCGSRDKLDEAIGIVDQTSLSDGLNKLITFYKLAR